MTRVWVKGKASPGKEKVRVALYAGVWRGRLTPVNDTEVCNETSGRNQSREFSNSKYCLRSSNRWRERTLATFRD